MADPLSVTASMVALVTAAIQSTKSLNAAVKRYMERDKTLRRLQGELEDLTKILETLDAVSSMESSIMSLLEGPVSRCSQLCREFEATMNTFSGKSKAGFRDWTKMEFMRGDIHEFIDALGGYKSTISVGLGTITMQTSKLSHQVLEEYSEVIKDTAYDLNIHLERIDEKIKLLTTESVKASGINSNLEIDLQDEKAVTEQCIRICEDASSYLESVMDKESSLQPQTQQHSTTDSNDGFEASSLTRKALNDHRDHFAEMIGRMRERLEILASDDSPGNDRERARLEKDIEASRQCLEVCKVASSEVSTRKIYRIGEAVAEGDSDQMLVTSLADLFDVEKALSRGKSAQLLGSMSDETLQKVSEQRYGSRFRYAHASGEVDMGQSPQSKTQSSSPLYISKNKGTAYQEKPNPNEVRKRTAEEP